MLSHSKTILVRKVGIYSVLASYMAFPFDGMLLLDPSGKSDMCQRCVNMSFQTLMTTSPLYVMSHPVS